jgi:hypothetical protein
MQSTALILAHTSNWPTIEEQKLIGFVIEDPAFAEYSPKNTFMR